MNIAIPTNGAPNILNDVEDNTVIFGLLDKIFVVGTFTVCKSHRDEYQKAPDMFDFDATCVGFMSSSARDLAARSSLGFYTVWINLFRQLSAKILGSHGYMLPTFRVLPARLDC